VDWSIWQVRYLDIYKAVVVEEQTVCDKINVSTDFYYNGNTTKKYLIIIDIHNKFTTNSVCN